MKEKYDRVTVCHYYWQSVLYYFLIIIAHITKLHYEGIFRLSRFFTVFTELLPRTTLVSYVRLQRSFGNELRVKRFIPQSQTRSKKNSLFCNVWTKIVFFPTKNSISVINTHSPTRSVWADLFVFIGFFFS